MITVVELKRPIKKRHWLKEYVKSHGYMYDTVLELPLSPQGRYSCNQFYILFFVCYMCSFFGSVDKMVTIKNSHTFLDEYQGLGLNSGDDVQSNNMASATN